MRSYLFLFILAFAAASRVFIAQWAPDLANFSIVGALAFVAGAYGGFRGTSIFSMLSFVFLSDVLINVWVYKGQYGIIHQGFYWPYAIFVGILWMGSVLSPGKKVGRWVIGALFATILHAGLLDGMYWLGGGADVLTGLPLPKNLTGLIQAYIQGLPFAKNFFLGTVFYSLILMICLEFTPQLWVRVTERISG